jgi:hypothetical protein
MSEAITGLSKADWAQDLHDHGYAPIPLLPRSKKPAVPWKTFRENPPTAEQIAGWWQQNPDFNIALLTGRLAGSLSGLVVVDADDDRAMDLVETTCAETSVRIVTSRGCHYWYQHPGGNIRSGRVLDDPPVDIKADGGLATAPGSVHASGHLYRLGVGCDLASILDLPFYDPEWFPMPAQVLWTPPPAPDFRTLPQRHLDRIERAEKYLDVVPGTGKGNRSEHAVRVAFNAIRDMGLTFEEAWPMFQTWNEKNDPPLDLIELRDILRSALANGRKPAGWKAEALVPRRQLALAF